MKGSSPVVKHLVLVGGGHSHLAVLKHLGMNPVAGLSVTLISRDIVTPYSGSLPGLIAGQYDFDDIHIDLRPLARFANARIIQEEVTEIDLTAKRIVLHSRPAIPFDLISLNIGSRPDAHKISGAARHATGVKPIDRFLQRWQEIRESALERLAHDDQGFDLVIVGGGPASVELAFAAQYRIHQELGKTETDASGLKITIVSADNSLLGLHNQRVRDFAMAELTRRGIEVRLHNKVTRFEAGRVVCEDDSRIPADAIVFATGASIPQWPGQCGLALSDDGFIEVNRHLQSTSHDFVFAAGDAATIRGEPRPKSGVYAVRQGKPLAENLVRYATGRSLVSYRPQHHALALLSMGNKTAIASRNNLFYQGRWVWHLKNSIDTRFIRKYSELPEMEIAIDLAPGLVDRKTELELREHAMRCSGCGAKVAANILEEVLQQLPEQRQPNVITGDTGAEDAALIRLDNGQVLVQSVDQLRAFTEDPWLFARIATNHCLSDIYAMGCRPHSALALVGLPFASKKYTRAQMKELMLGCSKTLQENDCSLVGGHSAESGELFFGLCVNGFSEEDRLLRKSGLKLGDMLILTRALGSGTLLAADMRCRASHPWIDALLNDMLLSNREASDCVLRHGATACTDITGFGLAGHLLEMLEAGGIEVELKLDQVPAMAGALETLEQGIHSSLHQDNKLIGDDIYNTEAFRDDPRFELLFDPQTAGGLLVSVPEAAAEQCLRELRQAGYGQATIIGRVARVGAGKPAIVLR